MQHFKARIGAVAAKYDEPLAGYTTLNIGGPADVMVFPQNEDEVLQVVRAAKESALPLFVLGGGSNLLISDAGIRGVVLQLGGEMEKIAIADDGTRVTVGAAATFPKLTKVALDLGIESALGWHGTPGSVGGALKMNAGGRMGEIGEVVHTVHAVSAEGFHRFSHEECGFRYRNSAFPSDAILTFAELHSPKADRNLAPSLTEKARELVVRRKKTQPKQRSAGSMFKNPPGDFAGRLIEACGLKGTRIGDAQISEVHANFFVNLGRANAQDLHQLSQLARETVFKQFAIVLEYEVKLVGEGFSHAQVQK